MGKNGENLHNAVGWEATKPFNGLPLLPPGRDLESRAVLKKCIVASAKLAALKEAAALIPNQDVLINSIPLREAKDSSAIENIVTTSDDLFRYANADPEFADPGTKEALRYRSALFLGFASLNDRPLSTRTAIDICRAVKDLDLDIRKTPGTHLRNGARQIVYSPPEGEALLRNFLANWEAFLHTADDIDPLVRMAVAHYQFEAIHPFPDGNGRTGRILNILFLIEKGLLDLPILYLSRFILDHRADYYRLLLDVTAKGAWEPWVLFMLQAIEETAEWTRDKVWAIKRLMDETVRFVAETCPKIYSRELVELIFEQPYVRIADVVQAGQVTRKTASLRLSALVSADVLVQREVGREKLFINRRFLDLLMSDQHEFEAFGSGT